MYKRIILLILLLLVTGCSQSNSNESSQNLRSSCIVTDIKSEEILSCSEGETEFMKFNCNQEQKVELSVIKITFNVGGSCPTNGEYYGNCNMQDGALIDYSYYNSRELENKLKNSILEDGKKMCARIDGKWH